MGGGPNLVTCRASAPLGRPSERSVTRRTRVPGSTSKSRFRLRIWPRRTSVLRTARSAEPITLPSGWGLERDISGGSPPSHPYPPVVGWGLDSSEASDSSGCGGLWTTRAWTRWRPRPPWSGRPWQGLATRAGWAWRLTGRCARRPGLWLRPPRPARQSGHGMADPQRPPAPLQPPDQPWYLATSLGDAHGAVAWHWQRGWIEQSFNDAKRRCFGPSVSTSSEAAGAAESLSCEGAEAFPGDHPDQSFRECARPG